MKKNTAAALVLVMMMSVPFALAGCSQGDMSESTTESSVESEGASSPSGVVAIGAPALMPADHLGRYEDNGSATCLTCHAQGEQGQVGVTGAMNMPAFHFAQDGSIDPGFATCLSCHSVSGE